MEPFENVYEIYETCNIPAIPDTPRPSISTQVRYQAAQDNALDGSHCRANHNVSQESSREIQQNEQSSNEEKKNYQRCVWIVLIIATVIAAIVTIAMAATILQKNDFLNDELMELKNELAKSSKINASQSAQGHSGTSMSRDNARSCSEIRNQGFNKTGIYKIETYGGSPAFNAFCDMTSDGGGWTLVASVHENNIDVKCTFGDKWSSEQGNQPNLNRAAGNWENFNTFGDIEVVTSQDYKNSAYYDLEASDVLIWHVPNNVRIRDIDEKAFLKYHTTDGFLSRYGSTLQSFYANYASMEFRPPSFIREILHELNSTQVRIQQLIPSWYSYNYDQGTTASRINDGGGDMYDNGNMVAFKVNDGSYTTITYGQLYSSEFEDYQLTSAAIHPFIVLAWIGEHGITSFNIKVTSNAGADGFGSTSTYQNNVRIGDYDVNYRSFQVYDTSDPKICEVYFSISNSEKWDSIRPTPEYPNWSDSTNSLVNEMSLTGGRNVLAGYILLSRTQGQQVASASIDEVMQEITSSVDKFASLRKKSKNFVSAINFVKGDNASVTSQLSASQGDDVIPGFLELRSYDRNGLPFALCPGIRMNNGGDPASYCVGGINSNRYVNNPRICGDYAGWNRSDPQDAGLWNNIHSTILIFARNSNETGT